MNIHNILRVADYIENEVQAYQFDMNHWVVYYNNGVFTSDDDTFLFSGNPIGVVSSITRLSKDDANFVCKTAGCIAGWTAIMAALNNEYDEDKYYHIDHFAEDFLGLDNPHADSLFHPIRHDSIWRKYKAEFDFAHYKLEADEFDENMIEWVYMPGTITNKDAAEMLRGIASGKYNFES